MTLIGPFYRPFQKLLRYFPDKLSGQNNCIFSVFLSGYKDQWHLPLHDMPIWLGFVFKERRDGLIYYCIAQT